MSHEPHDESLNDFARRLAGLAPRRDRLDRDRLMFLAGQASTAPPLHPRRVRDWIWPGLAGLMSAAAATLLVMLVERPVIQVVQRVEPEPVRQQVAMPGERPVAQGEELAGLDWRLPLRRHGNPRAWEERRDDETPKTGSGPQDLAPYVQMRQRWLERLTNSIGEEGS